MSPEDTRDPKTLKAAWLRLALLGTVLLLALGTCGLLVVMQEAGR
jgi:hypothetical protein